MVYGTWSKNVVASDLVDKSNGFGRQEFGDSRAGNAMLDSELIHIKLSESSAVEIKSVIVCVNCLHCGKEHEYIINRNSISLNSITEISLDGKSGSAQRYFHCHVVCLSCEGLFTIKLS